MSIDLSGCNSYEQLITKLEIAQQQHPQKVIVGRGWDETLWREKELPTNEKLNKVFPNTPVCLFRIDEHTVLVNEAMLNLHSIEISSTINENEFGIKNGKLTGILKDGAIDQIRASLPNYSNKELKDKIIEIQNEYLMYGVTNVHDAGLEYEDIQFYKNLIDNGRFKMNLYGMLLPTKKNIEFAKKNKIYEYKNLTIRSFKIFADGSLGGRGALLKKKYTDDASTHGNLTVTKEKLDSMVQLCLDLGYQLNTHAIGDSSVSFVLNAYKNVRDYNPDHRWRIEHAQVVSERELPLFAQYGIIPSIQPSHALADYLFAEKRLGVERMKGAYAYRSLLDATGIIAIGTDYPIVEMSPFQTIYAACVRKNTHDFPADGFAPNESISMEECLRGMTLWGALASFQEDHYGTLTEGMDATFAIFDRKVTLPPTFQQNFALHTFINGVEVYSAE